MTITWGKALVMALLSGVISGALTGWIFYAAFSARVETMAEQTQAAEQATFANLKKSIEMLEPKVIELAGEELIFKTSWSIRGNSYDINGKLYRLTDTGLELLAMP